MPWPSRCLHGNVSDRDVCVMAQDTLNLTEQQREAVLAARHDLLSCMRTVIHERRFLVNSLQVRPPPCTMIS